MALPKYQDPLLMGFLNADGITVTPISSTNPLPGSGGGGGGGDASAANQAIQTTALNSIITNTANTGLGALVLVPTPSATAVPSLTMTSAGYNSSGKFASSLNAGYGVVANALPSATILTVEAWVKTSSLSATKVACGQGSGLFIGADATHKALAHYGSGGTEVTLTSTVTIDDGSWHHLALVLNSSGGKLYVDGTLGASSAITPTTAVVNIALQSFAVRDFGGFVGGSYTWPGEVDEIAIWNTAQYTSNFTPNLAAYTGQETGLYALYHLDGNSSNALYSATSLGAPPANSKGIRFYLASSDAVTFTILPTAPTASPPVTFTISGTTTGPNWDESLTSQNIYITSITGTPKFRWY